jgi:transcriptional regulator with XRE-family HTH domain
MAKTLEGQRLRHGWTIQDLADRCAKEGHKVSIQQLGKIERGVHAPRPGLRAVLARLLELDDGDLPAYRRPGRRDS